MSASIDHKSRRDHLGRWVPATEIVTPAGEIPVSKTHDRGTSYYLPILAPPSSHEKRHELFKGAHQEAARGWRDHEHFMSKQLFPEKHHQGHDGNQQSKIGECRERLVLTYRWSIEPALVLPEMHPRTMPVGNYSPWAQDENVMTHLFHPENHDFYTSSILNHIVDAIESDRVLDKLSKPRIMIAGNGSGNVLMHLLTTVLKHRKSFEITCLDINEKQHKTTWYRLHQNRTHLQNHGHGLPDVGHDEHSKIPPPLPHGWDEHKIINLGQDKNIRFFDCYLQNPADVSQLRHTLASHNIKHDIGIVPMMRYYVPLGNLIAWTFAEFLGDGALLIDINLSPDKKRLNPGAAIGVDLKPEEIPWGTSSILEGGLRTTVYHDHEERVREMYLAHGFRTIQGYEQPSKPTWTPKSLGSAINSVHVHRFRRNEKSNQSFQAAKEAYCQEWEKALEEKGVTAFELHALTNSAPQIHLAGSPGIKYRLKSGFYYVERSYPNSSDPEKNHPDVFGDDYLETKLGRRPFKRDLGGFFPCQGEVLYKIADSVLRLMQEEKSGHKAIRH